MHIFADFIAFGAIIFISILLIRLAYDSKNLLKDNHK